MDEFNFYKFIAYLIGFAIAALLLLKLYLMSKYGQDRVNQCFHKIETIFIKSLVLRAT